MSVNRMVSILSNRRYFPLAFLAARLYPALKPRFSSLRSVRSQGYRSVIPSGRASEDPLSRRIASKGHDTCSRIERRHPSINFASLYVRITIETSHLLIRLTFARVPRQPLKDDVTGSLCV